MTAFQIGNWAQLQDHFILVETFWSAVQNFSLCSYSFFLLRTDWDMHPYFIHKSRWLSLFVLLSSVQVLADPCSNCGRQSEPGKDGQMFCRTCDSGKSASPPTDLSSSTDDGLKSSAAQNATGATNSEIPAPELYPILYNFLSLVNDDNDESIARVQVGSMRIYAVEREDGDVIASLAELITLNLINLYDLIELDALKVEPEEDSLRLLGKWEVGVRLQNLLEIVEQRPKLLKIAMQEQELFETAEQGQKLLGMFQLRQTQLKFLLKLHQALLSEDTVSVRLIKTPMHEKAEALGRKIAAATDPSQWPDLSDMGMVHLLTAEFQNSPLTMDLTFVFNAIQQGNMVQLIITQATVADEGNQAVAGTVRPVMHGAIIPNPIMNAQTVPMNMHLLLGTLPLHVNQDNLMNTLTAIMGTLAENEHNAHLSLHFFLPPQAYIQDNEDPLLSIPDIEHSINRNLPDSALSQKLQ
ncbi:hypothetical protein [Endozoicomonas sp. 8E]|uniref:hypothetical protein n=1 Tax=Endozoicomonas sp. 8E TaxID=3035692 RepID=UPI002939469D|nr:hypothetical protein [Endozoicomonas sp. 8E]WOG27765.1 hypothetical protein P6910_24995 [Endozoicomonas sp. 8E]